MGWRGKRAGAAVLLLAVLTLGVWACGGKDSASEHAKSADVATTAATGPKGSTGVTGPSGTTGAKRAKQSGGSSPPSTPTAQAPTPTAPSTNTNKPGHKRSSKKKRGPAYDPDNPTSGELAGLYSEARQVCQALTLQGLAHEYVVAATPNAVAKAYADAYAKIVKSKKRRDAVYRGCKDGVS